MTNQLPFSRMHLAAIFLKVPNEGERKQEAAARFDAARVAI